jgi:hypothetical protein
MLARFQSFSMACKPMGIICVVGIGIGLRRYLTKDAASIHGFCVVSEIQSIFSPHNFKCGYQAGAELHLDTVVHRP